MVPALSRTMAPQAVDHGAHHGGRRLRILLDDIAPKHEDFEGKVGQRLGVGNRHIDLSG